MKADQHMDSCFCEPYLEAEVCLWLSWLFIPVCVLQNRLQQRWDISPAWRSRPVRTCTENQAKVDFMSGFHQQGSDSPAGMMALPLPDASVFVYIWTWDSVSYPLFMFVSMGDFCYFWVSRIKCWLTCNNTEFSFNNLNAAKLLIKPIYYYFLNLIKLSTLWQW